MGMMSRKVMTGAVPSAGGAWDISTFSYLSKSFNATAQATQLYGLWFKSDGTKMYLLSTDTGVASVFQYSLSTAWDVSTASYDSVTLNVETLTIGNVGGISFNSSGSKMYITKTGTFDDVLQYRLSTPWDLSTASYDSKLLDISSQDGAPQGNCLSSDGAKMYVSGAANDRIYQYNLSVADDISTGSYASKSLDVSGQDATPTGVFIRPDGIDFYATGAASDVVYQYVLSTPDDISTGSYASKSLDVSTEFASGFPAGLFISPDGINLYIPDLTNGIVYQYGV